MLSAQSLDRADPDAFIRLLDGAGFQQNALRRWVFDERLELLYCAFHVAIRVAPVCVLFCKRLVPPCNVHHLSKKLGVRCRRNVRSALSATYSSLGRRAEEDVFQCVDFIQSACQWIFHLTLLFLSIVTSEEPGDGVRELAQFAHELVGHLHTRIKYFETEGDYVTELTSLARSA